ncbi:MAG: M48 family metalloprotease [Methylococcaceae bacterium]|nr:M48 family metalloprotease [Methylococcaceae bacterium]
MFTKKLLTVVTSCLLVACATSPTGRSQIAFMPDAEMNQMGMQAFGELKKTKAVSRNTRYKNFVNCIANHIIRQVGGKWEVVVFEDKSLNAFALPGNKIGVHTGLVNMVDNQHQLAAVIGHEVGHVMAKHSNERMSQETALKQGMGILGAVVAPQTAIGQLGMSALGIGAQYGILLPYSRDHESESDVIGLDLMAKAGFDPRQSTVLWQKMSRASQGQQPPEFMSTHPAHDTRIQELNSNMPQAMQKYQQAQAAGKRPNCRK